MKPQPFLRTFVSPAALCALGFLAAMAAVLQYSLRAYVPGLARGRRLHARQLHRAAEAALCARLPRHGLDLLSHRGLHAPGRAIRLPTRWCMRKTG